MKKTLATAAISCIMLVNVCMADNIASIDKGKNTKTRVESRHYYEWTPGNSKEQGRWEFKTDKVFINEKTNENNRYNPNQKRGK